METRHKKGAKGQATAEISGSGGSGSSEKGNGATEGRVEGKKPEDGKSPAGMKNSPSKISPGASMGKKAVASPRLLHDQRSVGGLQRINSNQLPRAESLSGGPSSGSVSTNIVAVPPPQPLELPLGVARTRAHARSQPIQGVEIQQSPVSTSSKSPVWSGSGANVKVKEEWERALDLENEEPSQSKSLKPSPGPSASSGYGDSDGEDPEEEESGNQGRKKRKRNLTQRDRDRNRIACKGFRERRKQAAIKLTARNTQLDAEREIFRRRIAELDNEVQMYRYHVLQELETENLFLKAQVAKYRKCTEDIMKLQKGVDEVVALGPTERGQSLWKAIDECLSGVLGTLYASSTALETSWVKGSSILLTDGRVVSFSYQLLPHGSSMANAHRINLRFEAYLNLPFFAAQETTWHTMSNLTNLRETMMCQVEQTEHGIPDLSETVKLFQLGGKPARALAFAARRNALVFPRKLWETSPTIASALFEHSVANVSLRMLCSPSTVAELGLEQQPQDTVARHFIGAVTLPHPVNPNQSLLTVVESHPFLGSWAKVVPMVDMKGQLPRQYLNSIIKLCCPVEP